MPPRTESFFEQDHGSKRPNHWRRPQHAGPLHETSHNATPPKPPIPATSLAKTKLKAFQFIPGQPKASPQDPDRKENMTPSLDGSSIREAVKSASTATMLTEDRGSSEEAPARGWPDDAAMLTKTPALSHAHSFPSTPGARLSLEDLIGNRDDNSKGIRADDHSPEEHLGWLPNSSSSALTPKRNAKRARSSSPSCPATCSQRQELSTFVNGTINFKGRQTLEADPAADLWKRYASSKQHDHEARILDFGNLVFPGSPRAVETPAKSAGLRRSASTGNDWPSTTSKRRRTGTRPNIDLWEAEHGTRQDTDRRSKVATMVEKIQESLASQLIAVPQSNMEPGPRPLSHPEPFSNVGASDVCEGTVALTMPEQRTQRDDVRALPQASKLGKSATQQPACDMVLEVERCRVDSNETLSAPLLLQSRVPMPAYKRPSITRPALSNARTERVMAAPAIPSKDLDDFADDLDLSAADFEELMIPQKPENEALKVVGPADLPQKPAGHDELGTPHSKGGNALQLDDTGVGDDEFECDDIDEIFLVQAELSATQTFRCTMGNQDVQTIKKAKMCPMPKSPLSIEENDGTRVEEAGLQRFTVTQVSDGEYTNTKGRRCSEKLLIGKSKGSSKLIAVTLRGSWKATPVAKGDIVAVEYLQSSRTSADLGQPPGQYMISDEDGTAFLIVHPDHMLSATTIADSFDCVRKAVLQDRIKATNKSNKSMVYGKILHEIFQVALSANAWDEAFLTNLVEQTLQSHLEGLWELGMKDAVLASEEIKAKMGELAAWGKVFVSSKPSDRSFADDKEGKRVPMSVSKLIAVEEHIWSPQYGLKGNIDATVEITYPDAWNNSNVRVIAPFEVKTGRTTQSPAHRAQTALYTVLLSDRYAVDVQAGMLYYLESSTTTRIAPGMHELRQMLQQRNRLAAYIHRVRHPSMEDHQIADIASTQEFEDSGLPRMLKSPFKCGKCYARDSCFVYHGLVENGSAESAGMIDDGKKHHRLLWQEVTEHLHLAAKDQSEAVIFKEWFSKWDRLLTFEETDLARYRKELWSMSSAHREAVGRCFGNLIIVRDLDLLTPATTMPALDGIEGFGGKINRFSYVFARSIARCGLPFSEGSQLVVGEPVVVSSEAGPFALANGYVVAVTKREITVAVDRRLNMARQRLPGFDAIRNQSYRGIMTIGEESRNVKNEDPSVLYRLDKDEFSNGLAIVRSNLLGVMAAHPIRTKLRRHIVLDAEPSFAAYTTTPAISPTQLDAMNSDQRLAIAKVLSAEDYALILGMPGTGKTTTIAQLIGALLVEDKSVLLTSFTHTAVDNILLKLKGIAPPNSILRLGVPAKIHPQVREFCQLVAAPRISIDEINSVYMGCKIVATTCMGTNHALFNRRVFDVCIVDEASQITLPISLGPLLHARKFVLVGDHYQLPPLVQNKTALDGGLDISLFRQLSERHPGAVASLGKQYRMCDEIMSLANNLIYDGRLESGNEAVAKRTLQVSNLSLLDTFHSSSKSCHGDSCWLRELIRPDCKVVFANTDGKGSEARESLTSGKNITNTCEALLTAQTVLGFLAVGVPASEIGVITLYRSQLVLIRRVFRAAGVSADVEVDSADRFQGKDKECIVLSMVRSNDAGIVGDLLKDQRRVNVALTRARSKMVMIGSHRTLRGNDLLARLLTLVDEQGWTLNLPRDADTCHGFDFESSPEIASAMAQDLVDSDEGAPPRKQESSAPSKRSVLGSTPHNVIRSPLRMHKQPGKVINGRRHLDTSKKNIAIDIYEDLENEQCWD